MRLLELQRQCGAGASAGVVARVTCSSDRRWSPLSPAVARDQPSGQIAVCCWRLGPDLPGCPCPLLSKSFRALPLGSESRLPCSALQAPLVRTHPLWSCPVTRLERLVRHEQGAENFFCLTLLQINLY